MKILIPGELNPDLVLQNFHSFPERGREVLVDDVVLTLGSSSAICAAGLARLGDQVSFIGKLGCDSWGDVCLNALAGFGVDCRLVQRDPGLKTGLTVSLTSTASDRALVTYLGAITALRESDILATDLITHQHLHVSSFFMQTGLRPGLERLFQRAHSAGLSTSLDVGFDPFESWDSDLLQVLEQTDVFLPNEVELRAITRRNDTAEALRALQNGHTLTIAKLGKEGCACLHQGQLLSVPAYRVQTVDTTGAGDSFNAGLLHSWLRGSAIGDAMRFASACGALSTLAPGGTGAQPTEAEVKNFMALQMPTASVS